MSYEELAEQHLNSNIFDCESKLDVDAIHQYFIDMSGITDPIFEISEFALKRLNDFLTQIYKSMTKFENIFLLVNELEKYWDPNSDFIENIKLNIVAKLDPLTSERTTFELYDEILNDIKVELEQLFVDPLLNRSINQRNIEVFIHEVFENNFELQNWCLNYE